MVRGLARFREHFASFEDHYVLIGGAACDLAMKEAGLDFRATKDLDIVLCIEVLDPGFVKAFWEFVQNGGYRTRQQGTGKRLFYRFHDPEDDSYPWMLELFCRTPDSLVLKGNPQLTPIPAGEELSSLSAILMNEGYYGFIHQTKREIEGLMAVTPECLIPLKARAWLDLTAKKDAGEQVDSKNINKHKNDVFRLFQLLTSETRVDLPAAIASDLTRFIEAVEADPPDSLKPFGLTGMGVADVTGALRAIYGLRR